MVAEAVRATLFHILFESRAVVLAHRARLVYFQVPALWRLQEGMCIDWWSVPDLQGIFEKTGHVGCCTGVPHSGRGRRKYIPGIGRLVVRRMLLVNQRTWQVNVPRDVRSSVEVSGEDNVEDQEALRITGFTLNLERAAAALSIQGSRPRPLRIYRAHRARLVRSSKRVYLPSRRSSLLACRSQPAKALHSCSTHAIVRLLP